MTGQEQSAEIKRSLRGLRFFAFSMIASCAIFLLVSIFLVHLRGDSQPAGTGSSGLLLAADLLVAFVCLLLAKRILLPASAALKVMIKITTEAMSRYRKAFLVSLLLQEIAVWGSLMLYVFTMGFPFLVVAAVILGVMIAGVMAETRSMRGLR